jgi:hypothetical protein
MNKSESITNLAVAIVKFNGEISRIAKDANNPFFKNSYATLDHIVDEVRPILNKHGLAVMQIPGGDGENVIMKTLLIHESGEWMESEPLAMKPVKNDPQAVGSCITYARRYSLNAFLSLSTGEDDDGNKATHGNQTPTTKTAPSKQNTTNDQPSATLRAKYETWHGSMDGYDSWYASQKQKFNDKQIEHWLTKQISLGQQGA